MDYLSKKISDYTKALESFEFALKKSPSEIVRDACIQRFEYTYELSWKSLKIFLLSQGIACTSPKECIREARIPLSLLADDIEIFLAMSDDRNITVHTYSEENAEALYLRLPRYAEIFRKVLTRLQQHKNSATAFLQ